jgi:hypothetical protein
MKLEFSRQIFEKKFLNIINIGPMGAKLFHAGGRTEGHDEADSRFSEFYERVWKI